MRSRPGATTTNDPSPLRPACRAPLWYCERTPVPCRRSGKSRRASGRLPGRRLLHAPAGLGFVRFSRTPGWFASHGCDHLQGCRGFWVRSVSAHRLMRAAWMRSPPGPPRLWVRSVSAHRWFALQGSIISRRLGVGWLGSCCRLGSFGVCPRSHPSRPFGSAGRGRRPVGPSPRSRASPRRALAAHRLDMLSVACAGMRRVAARGGRAAAV